jgi:formamidopyrimidine-DNA glycosylase
MPELPEVQTVVDDLNKKIKGHMVVDFWSDWPKAIKGKSLEAFRKEIKGKKILKAWRLGKNMFIDLSGNKTIYIHLKMTGHLLIKDRISKSKVQIKSETQKSNSKRYNYFDDKVNQFIHHIWYLGKKKTLEFSDMRKFAKIVLVDTNKVKELPEIKKLGVDAMSKEFTLKKFKEILNKRKNKAIGAVLMEQELIAGIGNIYRSEILFEASVLPVRKISSLIDEEVKKIYKYTIKTLEKAIKLRGTSDSDYRDTAGAPGGFQKVLKVYGKTGKKCRKCDTLITRGKMVQRSVFFCSKCQK